ncbi:MAG: hypothetical protein KDE27_01160, partial [Planctomycetes bacterium]|nr:hypothetical protein [Planctomycetota bacterium]
MISLALLRHLLPRCAVCSCVASLLPAAPQGPKLAGTAATSTLVLPVRPEEMAHAPFVDAIGQPVPATVTHFGTLDLDGNRIADAFWLGDAGHGPELALAMGRE